MYTFKIYKLLIENIINIQKWHFLKRLSKNLSFPSWEYYIFVF